MPEHPAELPAEAQEGGSGTFKFPGGGGIGGPAELPPFDFTKISIAQLVNEIFRLRNRVHILESNMLAARFRVGSSFFGGGIGGPNELPEGEGGGGGGGSIPFPGEIHEIAELPSSRFVAQLSGLVARFAQFEKLVTQQLDVITQRLGATKK